MRLINFGPGEMADRLTILSLKILHAKELNKPVDHFEQERNALLAQFPRAPLAKTWFEQFLELQAVNAIIWQDTDDVRAIRTNGMQTRESAPRDTAQLAALCVRLQVMNDRRAQLISLINVNLGATAVEEKI